MALSLAEEENRSLLPLNAPFARVPNELDSTSRCEHVEGLKGYDEDFDPPLENQYKCSICRLRLREPVQTKCGHRFCRKCLERFMRVILLQQEQQLCNGGYIWKIENIDRCCQDAISGVSPVMYSPGFYTSPYGYKMCLQITLNGVKSGVGTHVALHVHMMRGDHDKHLEWPFSKGFSLSIVDQSEGSLQYHITKTVITKPELSAFQRPVPPWDVISSEYSGYEDFVPIDKIHKPQYCKDNTLLVKFELTD